MTTQTPIPKFELEPDKKEEGCIFCHIEQSEVLWEDNSFFIKKDSYPVTSGHLLIISKEHYTDYLDLKFADQCGLVTPILKAVELLKEAYPNIQGYNIGMNCGIAAGQSVMHFHCHIIPRYANDTKDPTGGVRKVIPEKSNYLNKMDTTNFRQSAFQWVVKQTDDNSITDDQIFDTPDGAFITMCKATHNISDIKKMYIKRFHWEINKAGFIRVNDEYTVSCIVHEVYPVLQRNESAESTFRWYSKKFTDLSEGWVYFLNFKL